MNKTCREHGGCFNESRTRRLDEEMTELSLLLPAGQAAQMERLAYSRDLTCGQLIRLLIREYLADPVCTARSANNP